jgi:hypothetical protein
LRDKYKGIYGGKLDDVKVDTFINKSKFDFPPNMANVVFYDDVVELVNTSNNTTLGQLNLKEDSLPVSFNHDTLSTNIQLLPEESASTNILKYKPIKYGDGLVFRIPYTSYVLRHVAATNDMVWLASPIVSESPKYQVVTLIPVDKSKENSYVTYADEFYMKYGTLNNLFAVNTTGKLKGRYNSFDKLEGEGYNTKFKFNPKIIVYYCDNGVCSPVELKKTKTIGENATYNGKPVYRSPGCFGMCVSKKKLSTTKIVILYTIGIVFIGISILLIMRNRL